MNSAKRATRVTGAGLGVAAAGLTIAWAFGSVPPGAAARGAAATGTALARSVAPPYAAPTRVLKYGVKGGDVKSLQERLAALKYYPGTADGIFGADTLEALWAFQEVQGVPVTGQVDAATAKALVVPHPYSPRHPSGGPLRVEVNLGTRVLVLYRAGEVALISHISSGGGYAYHCDDEGCARAITPTGDYRTTHYMAGLIKVPLGEMYNPVFFIRRAFAIHGEPAYGATGGDVPVNPVSHGCVRIPDDIAQFFPGLVKTPGTPVYVYS